MPLYEAANIQFVTFEEESKKRPFPTLYFRSHGESGRSSGQTGRLRQCHSTGAALLTEDLEWHAEAFHEDKEKLKYLKRMLKQWRESGNVSVGAPNLNQLNEDAIESYKGHWVPVTGIAENGCHHLEWTYDHNLEQYTDDIECYEHDERRLYIHMSGGKVVEVNKTPDNLEYLNGKLTDLLNWFDENKPKKYKDRGIKINTEFDGLLKLPIKTVPTDLAITIKDIKGERDTIIHTDVSRIL